MGFFYRTAFKIVNLLSASVLYQEPSESRVGAHVAGNRRAAEGCMMPDISVCHLMTSPIQNILAGTAAATLIALLIAVPTLGGISTWKVVLAVIGLLLFTLSGGRRPT
jgi:hypothetical protein